MKIIINEEYFTDLQQHQGRYIFGLTVKLLQFLWFTDCGDWYLYLQLSKRYWRFSSTGFCKGVTDL